MELSEQWPVLKIGGAAPTIRFRSPLSASDLQQLSVGEDDGERGGGRRRVLTHGETATASAGEDADSASSRARGSRGGRWRAMGLHPVLDPGLTGRLPCSHNSAPWQRLPGRSEGPRGGAFQAGETGGVATMA